MIYTMLFIGNRFLNYQNFNSGVKQMTLVEILEQVIVEHNTEFNKIIKEGDKES